MVGGMAWAWVERCVRWTLAGLFLYSGVVKLIDPTGFAAVMGGFGLLPKPLLFPVAIVLPLFEVMLGLGLAGDRRGSLEAVAALLVLFMTVLVYGIHLGLDIDCGCFGPDDPEQAYKGLQGALLRDAAFFLAVGFLYWRRRCRVAVAARLDE